jgi:hypothetical protein
MSLTSCIMTYIARSADPQRPECTVLKALEISNNVLHERLGE